MADEIEVQITTHVKKGSTLHAPGEILSFPEDQAKALIEGKSAVRVVRHESSPVPAERALTQQDSAEAPEELPIDALALLIRQMDPNDSSHYTDAGIPRTNKLSELAGRDVTASERDQAFELYQSAMQ